jgi:hypothetical protein
MCAFMNFAQRVCHVQKSISLAPRYPSLELLAAGNHLLKHSI